MDNVFFDSWDGIFRSLIITITAYVVMILFLRVTGKRTLSKMNAFDFIVTIALGSSLATVALNKNVPLIEGALVFFLLIFLQYVISWISVRMPPFKKIITSQPTLLLFKGELFDEALQKQRVTIEEVYVAARSKGFSSLSEIDAIVLETTGDITIIPSLPEQKSQTLEDVEYYKKQF
jgi:uncharacterized membrane protein YcaP (DUF421 family)